MPAITAGVYRAAYLAAKSVYENQISERSAATSLVSDFGMSIGSAYDYIRVLGIMLDGKRYTRTINDASTRYYLTAILNDFGPAGLQNARQSLDLHIAYYEKITSGKRPSLRAIAKEFADALAPSSTAIQDFEDHVQAALMLSQKQLAGLLPSIGTKPETTTVTSTIFVRNPHVVAAARRRAKGVCERCDSDAPFKDRKTGKPFLEVHHIQTLADGGDDTLQNALALCPNCHRELHYA